MLDVIIALLPALFVGIYFFGMRAAWTVMLSVWACVGFEALWQKMTKQELTISDLSAVVTGLLLAFNMPADVPFYVPIVGAFVAIILAKQFFGGIGQNFINPALVARAFLLAAYPNAMTHFNQNVDTVSGATALPLLVKGDFAHMPSMLDAIVGNVGGCLGEVSAVAILVGGIYLLYKKIITWHIPVVYLVTVWVMTLIFGGVGLQGSTISLFLGGVMLGAFFMATDYTTTPMTTQGQIVFAVGCGVLTMLIRFFGGYPEGTSYSILIMNLTVPLIDRYMVKKQFGGGQKNE
jgi:electron transport complex protein RnfD